MGGSSLVRYLILNNGFRRCVGLFVGSARRQEDQSQYFQGIGGFGMGMMYPRTV